MTPEPRTVASGVLHHITQRKNNHQDVFFVDDDRRHPLLHLKPKAEQYGLRIHACCLMIDHVRTVATPFQEESPARDIGRADYFVTRYVNKLYGRTGHMWQNRFFSRALDDRYCVNTSRYLERKSGRAKIVRKALRYPWSSAEVHVAGEDPPGLLSFSKLPAYCKGKRWNKQLQEPEDEQPIGPIRRSTFSGHSLGSDRFISKIETRAGHD